MPATYLSATPHQAIMAPAAASLVTPVLGAATSAGWRLARHGPVLPAPACISPAAASHVTRAALTTADVSTTGAASGGACAAGRRHLVHATPRALGAKSARSQAVLPLQSPPQPGAPRRRALPSTTTVSALPEFVGALAASPYRDYYVLAGAAVGAVVWVKLFDYLAANGTLEQVRQRHSTTSVYGRSVWLVGQAG